MPLVDVQFTTGEWGCHSTFDPLRKKSEFMKNSIRRSPSARKASAASKAALNRYLAAGLGATGLASVECEAAIVPVDITEIGSNKQNISGPNAGMPAGSSGNNSKEVLNFPVAGQHTAGNPTDMTFFNVVYEGPYYTFLDNGVKPGRAVEFATGGTFASPFRFTEAGTNLVGPTLPEGQMWTGNAYQYRGFSLFRAQYSNYYGYIPLSYAPDWGPGSFIGFRARPTDTSTNWTYGYFEVTWTNATNTFEVISGAYESTVNTAIAVQPVPEPSAIALAGIGALALGAGAIRRSRKARKAAVGGSLA